MTRVLQKKGKGGALKATPSDDDPDIQMMDEDDSEQNHLKSFDLFNDKFKTCQSIDDFVGHFIEKGEDPESWHNYYKLKGSDASNWKEIIIKDAKTYLRVLRMSLKDMQSPFAPVLDWFKTAEMDLQIYVYTELFKFVPLWGIADYVSFSIEFCFALSYLRLFILKQRKDLELGIKARAFDQEPRARDVVTPIYFEILECYSLFKSDEHLSPYTLIVGPSGIGKSHVVLRIANYPSRSVMADVLSTLENDRASVQRGKIFDDMESELANHDRIRSNEFDGEFDYQKYLDKYHTGIRKRARKIIANQYQQLKASDESSQYLARRKSDLQTKRGHPLALFCLDEARGLLDPEDNPPEMRFLAFRRALRHQSMIGPKEVKKQLFGLILDMTSCVNDFSPPVKDDLSANFSHHALFPPIYRIDTGNIFAEDPMETTVQVEHGIESPRVTIDEEKLFSLGRPLWGAVMNAGNDGLHHALELAKTLFHVGKASTSFDTGCRIDLLALLSYRLNFYVSQQNLAEELTSGFLRYIVKVSENRSFIRTMQPSEPILAYLSMRMMYQGGGKMRRDLLNALFRTATEGFINIGDIGEALAVLVLLFSFDRSLDISLSRMDHNPSVKLGCVPITLFLSTSLPRTIFSEMEGRAKSRPEMERLWRGCIFFNHMVRIQRRQLSEKTLRMLFNRGAAIILPLNFTGADILIPVFIPEDDKMSYIIIQVKNRKEDSITGDKTKMDAEVGMKQAAIHLPTVKAHLALMMCLRCTKGGSQVLYPKLIERGQGRDNAGYRWNDMNRIVVLLCGLTLNMYPGLQPKNETEMHDAVESIKVMKQMLRCTAEDIGEEKTPLYQNLSPWDYEY